MRILSLVVTGYMLIALIWWTILLSQENSTIKALQIENLSLKNTKANDVTAAFHSIESTARKKSIMVIGEGIVFGLSLLIGLYLINRAYRRELAASEQQNNFLLAITHELKSPLTSMKMGLETLKRHNLADDIKEEIIIDSVQEGNRLEGLINNLLLANKIDSKYKFEKETIDIDQHLKDYIDQHAHNIPLENIVIETNSNASIVADNQALEIIYSNLIENAGKYAKDSELKIITSQIGDKVVLQFKDHGIGIPTKHKKSVLNKFYRIGSEETRKTKGTGLGLYIVKQIVEGHKGKLNIKDNIPQGCIIEIQIPISH